MKTIQLSVLYLLATSGFALGQSETIRPVGQQNVRILKTTPCFLVSLEVHNNKGSLQHIQLFDSKTTPANGVIPLRTYPVPANTTIMVVWPLPGLRVTNGVIACNSTTATTKTLGLADCLFGAQVQNAP